VSSASGNLTLDAQTINNWPIANFNFTGNGARGKPGGIPDRFRVDPSSRRHRGGRSVWVSGYTTPFGSAPPDFDAVAVNNEASVQIAGVRSTAPLRRPWNRGLRNRHQVCDPAILQVTWTSNPKPFTTLSDAGFSLRPRSASTAQIKNRCRSHQFGQCSAVTVVPTSLTVTSTFAPRYSVGNPATATITPNLALNTSTLASYSSFSSWVSEVNSTLTGTAPGLQLSAIGIYDRAPTPYRDSIDFVL